MIELTPKNTEYASYATSSLTLIDSISTDYINTMLAIVGVVGTLLVNIYFTWREDRRKEEEHEQFMQEHMITNEKLKKITK